MNERTNDVTLASSFCKIWAPRVLPAPLCMVFSLSDWDQLIKMEEVEGEGEGFTFKGGSSPRVVEMRG